MKKAYKRVKKNNKQKKGFTLIELIAVIIILAIIALIAIGVVTTTIDEARKSAYKTSVMHLFEATDSYLFLNGNSELTVEGIEVKTINTLDNNPFKTGIIFLNDKGNYEVSDVSDGEYCANGELENLSITKGACDVDKPTIDLTINKNVVTAHFTDNKELAGYACISGTEEPSVWNELSGKDKTVTCTFESDDTYFIWVKDTSNNKNNEEVIITKSAFCDYEEGHEWTYNYLGKVDEFTTPCNGVYKLELWGAQGGDVDNYTGGRGGYSSGNIALEKERHLFIVIGGAGAPVSITSGKASGGYNGGGAASYYKSWSGGYQKYGTGGGATHIATTNRGVLSNYVSYQSEIVIVAGGGGGAGGQYGYDGKAGNGGSGGGITGGSGTGTYGSGAGGTQTESSTTYSEGRAYDAGFGIGGGDSAGTGYVIGGGSGWFGGSNGYGYGGAGGGSGYLSSNLLIAGTTSMTNGSRAGHGTAKITLISLN